MKFKHYTNKELDSNKIYVQMDNFGYKAIVKIFEYNGNYYTNHPLQFKCTSIRMMEWNDLIGKKVSAYNSNGTFTGKLNSICLPDGTFSHKSDCFVTWDQGQRNIPGGWVDINALTFL